MGIKDFFKAIFSLFIKAERKLVQVQEILPYALDVAKFIALATPTRSDDEIIGLLNTYFYGSVKLTDFTNKGDALRAVARVMLQDKVRKDIRSSVLNAAIDLAALEFNN